VRNERNYGQFSAQPFERGLRNDRSATPCAECCCPPSKARRSPAVKIEGILHEFSPIPGVVEDATDIILNLKQVPFRLNSEGPETIYLESDASGVLTAANIKADGDVEILDKNVYLATISEGGKLHVEMRSRSVAAMFRPTRILMRTLSIGYIPSTLCILR
jgi:DNA-directed RNA polymerase subunit alpha